MPRVRCRLDATWRGEHERQLVPENERGGHVAVQVDYGYSQHRGERQQPKVDQFDDENNDDKTKGNSNTFANVFKSNGKLLEFSRTKHPCISSRSQQN